MSKRRRFAPCGEFQALFDDHRVLLAEIEEEEQRTSGVKSIFQKPFKDKVEGDARDCVQYRVLPDDAFKGCTRIRTIRLLLSSIDNAGFERSANQERFHDVFIKSCAPIIYKEDWDVKKNTIMRKNRWAAVYKGSLVSTPRRFGKTFSIAMFCVAITLTFKSEVVVFSPARRASRKILERMHEFVCVLKMEHRIIEYNQENLRLKALDGGESLIRSFPSKVSVRSDQIKSINITHTRTLDTPHPHTTPSRTRSRTRSRTLPRTSSRSRTYEVRFTPNSEGCVPRCALTFERLI